jgi:hypothetical protein
MPNCKLRLSIVLLLVAILSSGLQAQNAAPAGSAKKQQAPNVAHVPDLSGPWAVVGGSPSWDPSDPRGVKPDGLPMTP